MKQAGCHFNYRTLRFHNCFSHLQLTCLVRETLIYIHYNIYNLCISSHLRVDCCKLGLSIARRLTCAYCPEEKKCMYDMDIRSTYIRRTSLTQPLEMVLRVESEYYNVFTKPVEFIQKKRTFSSNTETVAYIWIYEHKIRRVGEMLVRIAVPFPPSCKMYCHRRG